MLCILFIFVESHDVENTNETVTPLSEEQTGTHTGFSLLNRRLVPLNSLKVSSSVQGKIT